jgi:hypothetical protein
MKQKKNKTNQVVTWPTATLFTIKELHRLNPKFVEITLRVRLSKAITETQKVAEIGSIPGEKGRPQKVFSMTPVTKATLDKARAEHINLVDNADKLVQYVSVTNPPPTPSVNPVVAPATAAVNS